MVLVTFQSLCRQQKVLRSVYFFVTASATWLFYYCLTLISLCSRGFGNEQQKLYRAVFFVIGCTLFGVLEAEQPHRLIAAWVRNYKGYEVS